MPTLKQLACNVEFGVRNVQLTEYATEYGDGVVSTYIAIPSTSQTFSIHLISSGYIAPGVAMFVFIDGKAQCNRNRRGLVMPDKKTDKSHYEVEFRVRQKEEKSNGRHFLGRQWTFEDLQTASKVANQPIGLSNDNLSGVGTIEVVVLRCHGEMSNYAPQAESAIDDGQVINLDGACDAPDNPHGWDPSFPRLSRKMEYCDCDHGGNLPQRNPSFGFDGASDRESSRDRGRKHFYIQRDGPPSRNYPTHDRYPAPRYREISPEFWREYYDRPRRSGCGPPPDSYYYQWPPRNYYHQAPRSYRRPGTPPHPHPNDSYGSPRNFQKKEQASIKDDQGWLAEPSRPKSPSNDAKDGWNNSDQNANNTNNWNANDNKNDDNQNNWTHQDNPDNQDNQKDWKNNDNQNNWDSSNNQDKWDSNDNQNNWSSNDNHNNWNSNENQNDWGNNDDQNQQAANNWNNNNNDSSDKHVSKKEKKTRKKSEQISADNTHRADGEAIPNIQDLNKPYIKPYWAKWNGCLPFSDAQIGDYGRRNPFLVPAEPQLIVPEKLAEDRKLSHLVQTGQGKMYYHCTSTPKYIDSMENPYAVFVFKYRSKETLQKMFPDLTIKEDRETFRSRMRDVPHDDLVEMIIRAKKHAGYATDSSLGSSSSSESDDSKKGSKSGSKKNSNNNEKPWGGETGNTGAWGGGDTGGGTTKEAEW